MGPAVFPVENTLPSPTGTVHKPNTAEEGRAEASLPVWVHLVKLDRRADSWSLPLLQTPLLLLITVGWMLEQRKRLGMGAVRKRGRGKTPGIRSQTPNYILISFLDQKIQNRENHKVQKLF